MTTNTTAEAEGDRKHLADYVGKLHIITGPSGQCMCGIDGITCSERLRQVSHEIGDCLLLHYMKESLRTEVTQAEVDQFLSECAEGEHPLSPEDEAALEASKPKLMRRLRERRVTPPPAPTEPGTPETDVLVIDPCRAKLINICCTYGTFEGETIDQILSRLTSTARENELECDEARKLFDFAAKEREQLESDLHAANLALAETRAEGERLREERESDIAADVFNPNESDAEYVGRRARELGIAIELSEPDTHTKEDWRIEAYNNCQKWTTELGFSAFIEVIQEIERLRASRDEAVKALEEARDDIGGLKDEIDVLRQSLDAVTAELEEAQRERDEAERDGKRLDWLEKNPHALEHCTWVNALRGRLFSMGPDYDPTVGDCHDTLRAAIDQATAAAREG